MKKNCLCENVLQILHQQSHADESALYFMEYPAYKNLILCGYAGNNQHQERYWRPHLAEIETIKTARQAKTSFLLPAGSLTRFQEKTVAVPIHHGDKVIGVIIHCYTGDIPSDLSLLHEAAGEYTNDFFSGWVEFLIAEQSRPLSVLFNIAGSISSSLDLDRVLLNVVEQATILFRVKMSSVMLVNWPDTELEMLTAYGCSLEYLDKPNVPLEGSFLGRVVQDNRAAQIENLFTEPAYLHKEYARKEGVSSLLAAPISFKNEALGVLNIYSASPRRWQTSEIELLQTFANHAAVAITNARVHNQVVSMEEQLQVSAKLATVGELAAGLAHEIRNPLAVINMLIHSWKAAPPNPVDFADDVNVIAQKITDLNTLVSDLLNLARNRPLDKRVHRINEVFDRVLRLLHHRITQQKVTVETKYQSRQTCLLFDRERMEQAILNLFLNALDVLPDGGCILIQTRDMPGKYAVEISDNGPGIPSAVMPEIFKAFHSTKPNGMGLGLPMTKRIVEEHKGEIHVAPNHPKGVIFTIFLPLEEE